MFVSLSCSEGKNRSTYYSKTTSGECGEQGKFPPAATESPGDDCTFINPQMLLQSS